MNEIGGRGREVRQDMRTHTASTFALFIYTSIDVIININTSLHINVPDRAAQCHRQRCRRRP